MPSTIERTQRRALTLTGTLASIFKSRIPSAIPSEFVSGHSAVYPPGIHHQVQSDCWERKHHLNCGHRPDLRRAHFIHALPREILAHVFVLGAEDHSMFSVTISHVCRAWRALALCTPMLWRRISLDSREDMWRERIYRAKSCALDIQLLPWIFTKSGARRSQHLDVHAVQWYMHLAIPYINRWRSLKISFTTYSPFLWNAALSDCCGTDTRVHAPFLKDISLIYPLNDDTKSFTLFAGFTPRLRRLTLDGLRLTWLPSLFNNLTFLDYRHHRFSHGYQAIREVLTMLEVSSRLVQLRVLFPWQGDAVCTLPGHRQIYPCVSLPSLTCLHICVNGQDIPVEMIHLMTHISTPALSSLQLLDLGRSQTPFPRLYPFLQAFEMPLLLKVLCVEHGWFSPHVVSCFNTLPYLEQFVVKRLQHHDRSVNLRPRNYDHKNMSKSRIPCRR